MRILSPNLSKNVNAEMIGQNEKKQSKQLNSLAKREVFGSVVQIPKGVKPVGYKWVFVRKQNEENEIVRYKTRLMAQELLQRLDIDYDETYSPLVDVIIFQYLISPTTHERLDMCLMDVVTTYLYRSVDNDVYIKIHERFQMPEAYNSNPQKVYSIKLQRSLYGLKQLESMWYNHLSEYLLREGYNNDPICPYIFIKKSESDFVIITVYVDDLNIIGTHEEIPKILNYLKKEFKMKYLGKIIFWFGL